MDNQTKTIKKENITLLKVNLYSLMAVIALIACCWPFLLHKSVIIEVDNQATKVVTFANTVEDLLIEQQVALLEKDLVTPVQNTKLQNNMLITIDRALDVTLVVDHQEISLRTHASQVGEVLDEYQVHLGDLDEVVPDMESAVSSGMAITVARIFTETATSDEPIDFRLHREYTSDLPAGSNLVVQEGREGLERQWWEITYRDGVEVFRELFNRETLIEPEDQFLICGNSTIASRGGENAHISHQVDMLASAYTHTGYNTASGIYPHHGAVAVDTSLIPLGTRMYIEGYGYATALDRGGAITGNRIDLFFDTHTEAVSWGMRHVNVYILE